MSWRNLRPGTARMRYIKRPEPLAHSTEAVASGISVKVSKSALGVKTGKCSGGANVFGCSLESGLRRSNQLQPLQARMPVLADDDVIVHGDAERAGDVDDRAGHLDIRLRRRRIAGGVVVHQQDRGGG